MAKFNVRTPPTAVTVPARGFLNTGTTPTGITYEGAPGFARDVKSELFLLAVANFVAEDTHYEGALERDARFRDLVHQTAVADSVWITGFLDWLRNKANMRSASIMGALEAAHAMVTAKIQGARQVVSSVLQRADEPGEALAYWLKNFGRKIPKPVKRGIADAAQRLYTQRNWIKWDSARSAVRFADVIQLCHVRPEGTINETANQRGLYPFTSGTVQSALFKYIVAERYGSNTEIPPSLLMVQNNQALRELAARTPSVLLDSDYLTRAGFTWEDALSLLGTLKAGDELKVKLWEAMIPNMGYMALLRNLRNFSEQGVSPATKALVANRLRDPAEVAKSKQFPYRFLTASQQLHQYSHDWAGALETALNHSVRNIPELPGRTLVMVDVSGSMAGKLSARSTMTRVQAAGLFGAAIAIRNWGNTTLVAFDDTSHEVPVVRNGSVLQLAGAFHARGGTYTRKAVQKHYAGHDRVIIITDEQSHDGDPGTAVPANVPLYTWNIAGYQHGSTAGKALRYVFGGLTDQSFSLIQFLEQGTSAKWPWETE